MIMGAEDVWNVSLTAPEAKLYLTHMDNVAMHQLHAFCGQLKKVFNYDACWKTGNYCLGKDSQLCGEEIFLFSQS